MSGHSKWSKVKHQKATTDVVKGAAFTKASHAIAIAVKEGGGIGDPAKNFRLRLAVEQARAVNMPKDNIERAIARAVGGSGEPIDQVMYEAYGPGGVALLIEAATDNRQRTVSTIKNILERAGGVLADPGAVGYLFVRKGVIAVAKENHSFDEMIELAVESGADDVRETQDMYEIYTDISALMKVKESLERNTVSIDASHIIMDPITTVPAMSEQKAQAINTLAETLEAFDDVQHVYTNLST